MNTELDFFNLEKAVSRFSNFIDRGVEGELELGPYQDRKRSVLSSYVRSLIQPLPIVELVRGDKTSVSKGFKNITASGLFGIAGIASIESDRKFGYIAIETGITDEHSGYCGIYETIKFITRGPIKLKSGATIPRLSIKIMCSKEELDEKEITRKDYYNKSGIWISWNYSPIIPSEWFLK